MTTAEPTVLLQHPRAAAPRAAALQVFLGALAIYLVFFGGHYVMGDHAERIAWAKSMIAHHFGRGSTDISTYVPNAIYCKFGIGQSLLHVPFLLLAAAIERLTHISCGGPVNMLPYVLNGALGVLMIYLLLARRLGVAPRAAAGRAMIAGLCTAWFVYTKVEYGEALVATALLAVWYFGLQRPLVAGIIAGAAITIRPEALIWCLITFLGLPARANVPGNDRAARLLSHAWVRRRASGAAWFAAGIVPAIALVVLSNIWRTGKPLSAGYEAGFIYPLWAGVYGLCFSAGKSLFLFYPLLILLIPAAWQAISAGRPRGTSESSSISRTATERRATAIWAIVLLGAQILFYGKWWDWSGDDSWGPRFLVPGAMAALVVVASMDLASPWRRLAFALLALAGITVQLPAVLMGPHQSLVLTHLRRPIRAAGDGGLRVPITLDDERFNPQYSQVTATTELLELKLTGRIPHARSPDAVGTTWLESFDPPLKASDFHLDVLWLNPPHRGAKNSAPAATRPPGKSEGAPGQSSEPRGELHDSAHRR